MKKIFYTLMVALGVLATSCDNEFAYPPVSLGDATGDGSQSNPFNIAAAIRQAAKNGETSDVPYYFEGYVVDGSIETSFGNATFYLYDDKEGTGAKFTCYRIKSFNNQKFTDPDQVKIGDKICVYSPIINYKGNTPETVSGAGYLYSVNGVVGSDIPELEAKDPVKDGDGTAASPYSAKQAYDMCAAGTYTSDKVYVTGYVTSVDAGSYDPSFGTLIFNISADGTTANQFEIYRGYSFNGDKFASAAALKAGDLVVVYGELTNYNGTYEMTKGGQLVSLNGSNQGGTQTPDQPSTPDRPGEVTGAGSESEPYSVAAVISGATGSDVWVKGYIVGFVDGAKLQEGAKFTADAAAAASNILIADNASETNVANCVPVQLVSGSAVRAALNLKDHPENLGKEVMIQGNLEAYFGVNGVGSISTYKLDGVEAPVAQKATFKLATSIAAGKKYAIAANDIVAKAVTGDYGYLYTNAAPVANGEIQAAEECEFTFTATTGGYFMQDAAGKYYIMKGTYNSFNLQAEAPGEEGIWEITFDGNNAQIKNVLKQKTIQFYGQKSSFGAYSEITYVLPQLYEKQ